MSPNPLTYASNRELEEIAVGILHSFYGERLPIRIDIDAIATRYLGLHIRYEHIDEEDFDKVGFAADGVSPLRVRRNGKRGNVVFPKGTIILDRFFLQPAEEARRRFTLAHELGHILLAKTDPLRHAACFQHLFDAERRYTVEELRQRQTIAESQTNHMAGHLLMPQENLEKEITSHFGTERVPVYGCGVLLPEAKPLLHRMAEKMGVSYSALMIQLQKKRLLERHDIAEYLEMAVRGADDVTKYRT